jgi:hypothetical protein
MFTTKQKMKQTNKNKKKQAPAKKRAGRRSRRGSDLSRFS